MPQTGIERHRNSVARLRAGQKPRVWHRRDGQPPRWDVALGLQEEGATYSQIADRMGVSWETARSLVRYGKLRWRLPGGHA
jgi:hypothetical protein